MIEINRIGNNKVMITGHSSPDICASVSCIMFTSVKLLEKYNKECIKYIDENDIVLIELLKRDNFVNMIFDNMIQCFLELYQDTPDGRIALSYSPDGEIDNED